MTARAIIALAALTLAACASEPAAVDEADYLTELEAICAGTTATFEALPQPPEQITVTEFATSAASALTNEAERIRALDAPDDLGGDHRALIRNTEEQAAAWRAVADAGEDLDALTVRIGELVRGRNDLADEMGAPACRRGQV